MTFVLAVTLAVLVYPYVFPPKRNRSLDDAAEELGQRLQRARDRVYEEIRALQQEYFLKTLSEDEYRSQLQQARHEAARLMREQQQVQQTLAEIEALAEKEMNAASKLEPLDGAIK
jgi:Tfp pilus assembly protein FimT